MASRLRRFFDLGFQESTLSLDTAQAAAPPGSQAYGFYGVGAAGAAGAASAKAGSFALLITVAVILFLLALLLHFLRRRPNRLCWEIACWALVVIGIVTRQAIEVQPHYRIDLSAISPGLLGVSMAVSLAVFPSLMRWLNRRTPRPSLNHVAIPFSIGFFLDLSQVLVSRYVAPLPWVRAISRSL